jgi:hypothetical protein
MTLVPNVLDLLQRNVPSVSMDSKLILPLALANVSQFVIMTVVKNAMKMVLNVSLVMNLWSFLTAIVFLAMKAARPVADLKITNVLIVRLQINSLMVDVLFVTSHA